MLALEPELEAEAEAGDQPQGTTTSRECSIKTTSTIK